jgi:hypothetical protein
MSLVKLFSSRCSRILLLLLHHLFLLLLKLSLDLLLMRLVLGRAVLPRLLLRLRDDLVRAAPLPLPARRVLLRLLRRLAARSATAIRLAALVWNLMTLI